MIIYSRKIVTESGEKTGFIHVANGIITKISDQYEGDFVDYSDKIIMPGFIDIHLHGWATGSFWMEKTAEAIRDMAKTLPKVGVTSFLVSTAADSRENTMKYITEANQVYGKINKGAELLGVHMEGPFINQAFKGMQKEEHCINPDLDYMKEIYKAQKDCSMIKTMTIAPELNGAKEVIEFCIEKGIVCSIGHSDATFECIEKVVCLGVKGVTHMYSGMRGLHHRELGVAGSALYFDNLSCEFAKQSGITIKHEAFNLTYRIKGEDKVYLTTDCCGYAQVKEPFYHYLRKELFEPCEGKLKVTDDRGSIKYINPKNYEDVKEIELSYLKSVKNMVEHTNMSWHTISKITSLNPAKFIGVDNRKGSLSVGKDADIIVLEEDFTLCATFTKGIKME